MKNEGLKVCLERGRVKKHITWEMMAQRRTQKEVELENTLLKRRGLKGTL
jgi:hypothetical protein